MGLRAMIPVLRAYLGGTPLGDVAVMKIAALYGPKPELDERLAAFRGRVVQHDLKELRKLPDGTLGREYARFLDANRITPLKISAAMRERFADNVYAIRYTQTHDLFHVLAGFDTSLAGEIGVLGFTVGQGAAPVGGGLFLFARCLYACLLPWQARRIFANARLGRRMGERAAFILSEPLEEHFAEPLAQVRARYGITGSAS